MKIVGLTGSIGSGKTTVSKMISNIYPVIDADVIAHQVVEPGKPAYYDIIKHYGPEILVSSGIINRKKLGQIIFNNPDSRKLLNKITHPRIRMEIVKQVALYWLKGKESVVIDAPLLIEGNLHKWTSDIIVVYCSLEEQKKRLMMRDRFNEDEARSRINAQLSMEEKCKYATFIVDNSKDLDFTNNQVLKVCKEIKPHFLSYLITGPWTPLSLVMATLIAVLCQPII
jgi:dephospho-CoA kinase